MSSLPEVLSVDACLHLQVLLEHTCYVDNLRSSGPEYSQNVELGKIKLHCSYKALDYYQGNFDMTPRCVPLCVHQKRNIFVLMFLHSNTSTKHARRYIISLLVVVALTRL